MRLPKIDINDLNPLDEIGPSERETSTLVDASPEQKPTFWQNLWKNRAAVGQGLLFGVDALASYSNEVTQDENREDRMRSTFQQKPIWDYNYMYGQGTNGGSQFQPIIKAEEGAEIRTDGSEAMPIEIEGGEFLMLPDGNLEVAKGPKHAQEGVDTMLPNGTKIFSAKLKPKGSKWTFAELAKKNDYTKHKKALENPFTAPYSKRGAELMLQRKQDALFELFDLQQDMNGDSDGEEMAKGGWIKKATDSIKRRGTEGVCTGSKFGSSSCPPGSKRYNLAKTFKKMAKHEDGGKICYDCGGETHFEEGGEYDLSPAEIKRLKKMGYDLEIL